MSVYVTEGWLSTLCYWEAAGQPMIDPGKGILR